MWDARISDIYGQLVDWLSLGFFAVEMTVPNDSAYDPMVHLNLENIKMDHPSPPSVVQVYNKASKSDPFQKGVNFYLWKTGLSLCPVAAILSYLCVRGLVQLLKTTESSSCW